MSVISFNARKEEKEKLKEKRDGLNVFQEALSIIDNLGNNKVYDSRENCNAIIHTATNTLIFGCCKTNIPNSVTNIGGWAFRGCDSLSSITISDGVIKIGSDSFSGCSSLSSVSMSEWI